jgi:biopolymer transport protein ExbD
MQITLMTELHSNTSGTSGTRKRAGVKQMIRHHLKVDMTPMVDLGFLLITFFVMTAELAKPTTTPLYMPKDEDPPTELGKSNALTLLIGDNKVYYYNGDWEKASQTGAILETKLTGKDDLRKIICDKQGLLDISQRHKEGRDGLMMLIKPGSSASYKTVVDVLDEATISRVKKYAIVKLTGEERKWLESQ